MYELAGTYAATFGAPIYTDHRFSTRLHTAQSTYLALRLRPMHCIFSQTHSQARSNSAIELSVADTIMSTKRSPQTPNKTNNDALLPTFAHICCAIEVDRHQSRRCAHICRTSRHQSLASVVPRIQCDCLVCCIAKS